MRNQTLYSPGLRIGRRHAFWTKLHGNRFYQHLSLTSLDNCLSVSHIAVWSTTYLCLYVNPWEICVTIPQVIIQRNVPDEYYSNIKTKKVQKDMI